MLYERLKTAQFDLFAHTSRVEMDQAYADTAAKLDRPLDPVAVQSLFQRFIAKFRIAHTRIDFPANAFAAFQKAGGKSFPFEVRIDDGRAFVTANRSANGRIHLGDEIIGLDGRPMLDWVRRYRRFVSADTDRLADTIVEYRLPGLMWLDRGERSSFAMVIRKPDGRRQRVTVAALTTMQQEANAKARPTPYALGDERNVRMVAPAIAYLRPGPFYNSDPADNPWDNRAFTRFVDGAFADFAMQGATSLIIDLRNNPGGDSSFSDAMIGWIADKPWRFAKRFTLRASPEAIASNAARMKAAADTGVSDPISPKFYRLLSGARPGSLVDFPLTESQPRRGGRFSGKVFVLIDRYCFSNCANVAATIQDYGFGTIVGEPTADLVTTQGAMEQFTLPRTGLKVGFAKARIVRPNGDETEAGVIPDIEILNPVARRSDVMLGEAVRLAERAGR